MAHFNYPPNMTADDPKVNQVVCNICKKEECTRECDCVSCIEEMVRKG